MDYHSIKMLHMSLAFLSVGGFVLRWLWRMRQSALASTRLVRTLPHILDSCLLLSAFWLILTAGHIPISHSWLGAKILGLLGYIVLGIVAMRTAPNARVSIPAFLAALLVFAWIVSVAFSKSPGGFFT